MMITIERSSSGRLVFLPILLILAVSENVIAADNTEQIGDALQYLIPAVAFGSTIFYEEGHAGTIQFVKAFATSQLTTQVLKNVTHETRPNGDCCDSFPSGHTSVAFMGAAFIHKRYGWEYSIPAYLGATYVGYSRVYADKHYVKDVVAGAAIGILSSFYFTEPYKGVEVALTADNGVYGIRFSRQW